VTRTAAIFMKCRKLKFSHRLSDDFDSITNDTKVT
jgi:hypothetical protein